MSPSNPVVCFGLDGLHVCVIEDLFSETDNVWVVLFQVEILGEDESCGWEMLGEFVGLLGILHCFAIEVGKCFDIDSLKGGIQVPHCQ